MTRDDVRCPESIVMRKKRIILEDGRYLIYYSFGDKQDKSECGQSSSNSCGDAEGRD